MNPEKIDYERLGDDYIADNGGIEDAFRKIDMPVYVIYRHGVYKRYLSRSAAIERLARVMASRVFRVLDLPVRYDSIFDPQKNAWLLGGRTEQYFNCKDRAKRRILRLLAKKREKEKWQREYDDWASKHDELMKRRPF
jgi:hypothetical protein